MLVVCLITFFPLCLVTSFHSSGVHVFNFAQLTHVALAIHHLSSLSMVIIDVLSRKELFFPLSFVMRRLWVNQ